MDVDELNELEDSSEQSSPRSSTSPSYSSETLPASPGVNSSIDSHETAKTAAKGTKNPENGAFGLPEAPVFYPTAKEFADPNVYLQKIRKLVEPYGICRIVPPKEWNRDGWKQQFDPRNFTFATKTQSVHTLQVRDGAYTTFMVRLQYYWTHVARQELQKAPELDGLPVDLFQLHSLVAQRGGYDQMKTSDAWTELLPLLHLNPHATAAGAILASIYRNFLLPYAQFVESGGVIPTYATTTQPSVNQGHNSSTKQSSAGSHQRASASSAGTLDHSQTPKPKPYSTIPPQANRDSPMNGSMATINHISAHSLQSHTSPPPSPYNTRSKRFKYVEDSEEEEDSHRMDTDDDSVSVSSWANTTPSSGRSPKAPSGSVSSKSSQASSEMHQLPADIATFTSSTLKRLVEGKDTTYFGPYGDLKATVSIEEAGSWRKAKAHSFAYEQDDSFVLCFYCRKGDRPASLLLCDTIGCSVGVHMRCMNPPLSRIPSGHFFCPKCNGETLESSSPLDAALVSPTKYNNGFSMKSPSGETLPDLELNEKLGFGHGFGKRYTLAEFKEMAMMFATFWFQQEEASSSDQESRNFAKFEGNVPGSPSTSPGNQATRMTRSSSNMRNGAKIASSPMVTSAVAIEKEYWRLVSSGEHMVRVQYGSDVDVSTRGAGSGFPLDASGRTVGKNCPELARWRSEDRKSSHQAHSGTLSKTDVTYLREHGWNLNSLPYVTMLKYLGESISGVTRPMMYVGMLFSSFCWHTEDNWLYSINYVHTGAPKRWYGVASTDAPQFEKAFCEALPQLFEAEPHLIHQLATVVHPMELQKRGVRLCTTLQQEGEIVVTFPRAYHSGFNCGYNVAESVNFAVTPWLEWGLVAANEYRFARSSVFPHEKLVWNIALSAASLTDLNLVISVSRQLDLYQQYAKKAIQRLQEAGIEKVLQFSNTHIALLVDSDGTPCDLSEIEDPPETVSRRTHISLMDRDGFEPDDPQCAVCGYDVFFHRVDCACKSPRIPRCLNHGDQTICSCTNDKKFISLRYRNSSFKAVQKLLQEIIERLQS
jgi:histone demethylase JARID1